VNVAGRLAAFALVLAVSFGGGWALGAAIGPDSTADDSPPTVDHGETGVTVDSSVAPTTSRHGHGADG
jgi:hypothetical protein